MTAQQVNDAAKGHAKGVLGEEQFKANKDAVNSIVGDFKAGVKWAKQQSKVGHD